MRMKLADHIADRARRLFILGRSFEAELAHGVNDAALYRLQSVADVRERPIKNDVHRVVEVGFFSIIAERQLLYVDRRLHHVCHVLGALFRRMGFAASRSPDPRYPNAPRGVNSTEYRVP